MTALLANNATSTLASAITDTDTTVVLATNDGASFPSPTGDEWFPLTLQNSSSMEIVRVTARSGDSLQVVRAQEGTTAQAFSVGDSAKLRFTEAVHSSYGQAADIALAVSDHAATNDHPLATTIAKGFLSAVDKTKLDTVESGATADQTKADIDALNIDADTLDGINSLGFDAAGAADTAVSDHVALPDPHSQYAEIAGQTFTGDIAAPGVTATGSFTSPGIDDNATSNAITIDSNENVGIGTDAPEAELHVEGVGLVTGDADSYKSEQIGLIFGRYGRTNPSTDRRHSISWSVSNYNDSENFVKFNLHTGSGIPFPPVTVMKLEGTGKVLPGSDNTQAIGSASLRWSEVFAGTGTINTSDAREKTPVRGMTKPEVSAAKDMGKEIGVYQFLASVEEKGDDARHHVGLTVQRAVEIMTAHGLEPFSYGFICFDEWDDVFVEHAGIEATDDTDAKAAWTEQTRKAGDLYGFRYDQLNLFIARGFESRLSALEDNA